MGKCPKCGKQITYLRTEQDIRLHKKFYKNKKTEKVQEEFLSPIEYYCPKCHVMVSNTKSESLKILRSELERKVDEYE
jgi:Zn finger protein HypA/HybF involved in hydrogenase expression